MSCSWIMVWREMSRSNSESSSAVGSCLVEQKVGDLRQGAVLRQVTRWRTPPPYSRTPRSPSMYVIFDSQLAVDIKAGSYVKTADIGVELADVDYRRPQRSFVRVGKLPTPVAGQGDGGRSGGLVRGRAAVQAIDYPSRLEGVTRRSAWTGRQYMSVRCANKAATVLGRGRASRNPPRMWRPATGRGFPLDPELQERRRRLAIRDAP